MNIPIISLEVQGMKHAVKVALTQELAAMDRQVQQAVEDYCTEDNISMIVRAEARRQIDEALKQSVAEFFGWSGNGRKAVREAVIEHLDSRYPLNQEPQ